MSFFVGTKTGFPVEIKTGPFMKPSGIPSCKKPQNPKPMDIKAPMEVSSQNDFPPFGKTKIFKPEAYKTELPFKPFYLMEATPYYTVL